MGAAIVTPEGLTAGQEEFCQAYTSRDREMFGHGVESYLEAFDVDKTKPDWYATAASGASRLLRKDNIILRLQTLLADGGLNEQHVDKELLFIVNQHADFGAKLGAIREFNKLKQRIIDKKDVTSGGKPITVIQAFYGDSHPTPLQPETVPDTAPQSDGQRNKESDSNLASEIG